ncbi:glycosyltransferase [Chryseolinea sp. T2]|uniref:glycosyltransferase n=1 Tax=Chryseolinea sp. T2 TaxID=3129255 RepID=UPI0030786764
MPARILFLCYHGVGHINPCFPLARILENEGHTVTLATVAHFNGHVTRSGFHHYPLKSVPFGLGFESWVNAQRKARFKYWADLTDRYFDRLYHERERELTTALDALNPDIIFFDATQATDFIVLYNTMKERHIGHAMLHAMFPTHVVPGRPPVDSTLVPGDDNEETQALKRMNAKLNRTDFKQRLLYLGISDRFLISRRLKKNRIPANVRLDLPSLFDFQTNNVPSFVLAPRQFDYPSFQNPVNYHYVGFMQAEVNLPAFEEWSKVKSVIQRRRASGSRLVYCSFGTIASGREEQTDAFLLRLADAVTRDNNQLVVSIGTRRTAPAGLIRKNVWVFPSVPQQELLRDSDAFITHGGLSSIKEAIEAIVPMLMIVVHQQFDPPGNAARVQFHGMGILGDIDADTDRIQTQLSNLMNDETFRLNIKRLRNENNAGAGETFLALFNQLLDKTRQLQNDGIQNENQ